MKKGEMRIVIKPEDINCNPENVTEMSEAELVEEHFRRLKKDPAYDPDFPPKIWVYHDEVSYMDQLEGIWGKKWGAQGIGKLKEVLVAPP